MMPTDPPQRAIPSSFAKSVCAHGAHSRAACARPVASPALSVGGARVWLGAASRTAPEGGKARRHRGPPQPPTAMRAAYAKGSPGGESADARTPLLPTQAQRPQSFHVGPNLGPPGAIPPRRPKRHAGVLTWLTLAVIVLVVVSLIHENVRCNTPTMRRSPLDCILQPAVVPHAVA